MLEPDQSLKFNGSPVDSDYWDDPNDLIYNSTSYSCWIEVHNSIRGPIRDVTLSQLQFPTMRLIYEDLKNVRPYEGVYKVYKK